MAAFFIAVAKDTDHPALLESVDDLDRQGKVRRFTYTDKRGHRHSFLAFLIDQIVELSCPLFNAALKANKRKKTLWEKQRNFFEIFVVSSWALFMKGLILQGAPEPKAKGKRVKPGEQPKRKMISIRSIFPDTA
ncbi:hypothetical protein [Endozoicomonas sp.]|uniref:hypothetical protein n=1 Tax=Endozoicomonas sp. TaxID=1892382 RepID=UPI00383BD565